MALGRAGPFLCSSGAPTQAVEQGMRQGMESEAHAATHPLLHTAMPSGTGTLRYLHGVVQVGCTSQRCSICTTLTGKSDFILLNLMLSA